MSVGRSNEGVQVQEGILDKIARDLIGLQQGSQQQVDYASVAFNSRAKKIQRDLNHYYQALGYTFNNYNSSHYSINNNSNNNNNN